MRKKKKEGTKGGGLMKKIIYHTGYRTTLEMAIHIFLLIYIYFNAIHDIINKTLKDIKHVKDGTSATWTREMSNSYQNRWYDCHLKLKGYKRKYLLPVTGI